MNKPKYILVHGSDVSYQKVFDQYDAINRYHRDPPQLFPRSVTGSNVGYHVLCTGKKVYKCKEDFEVGAHCNQVVDGLSMNYQSLAVCIGFDGDIEYSLSEDYMNAQKQVWAWQDKYPGIIVKFHRDYATWKTCPGSLITREWLTSFLTRPTVEKKASEQCVKAEEIIKLSKSRSFRRRLLNLIKKQ